MKMMYFAFVCLLFGSGVAMTAVYAYKKGVTLKKSALKLLRGTSATGTWLTSKSVKGASALRRSSVKLAKRTWTTIQTVARKARATGTWMKREIVARASFLGRSSVKLAKWARTESRKLGQRTNLVLGMLVLAALIQGAVFLFHQYAPPMVSVDIAHKAPSVPAPVNKGAKQEHWDLVTIVSWSWIPLIVLGLVFLGWIISKRDQRTPNNVLMNVLKLMVTVALVIVLSAVLWAWYQNPSTVVRQAYPTFPSSPNCPNITFREVRSCWIDGNWSNMIKSDDGPASTGMHPCFTHADFVQAEDEGQSYIQFKSAVGKRELLKYRLFSPPDYVCPDGDLQ